MGSIGTVLKFHNHRKQSSLFRRTPWVRLFYCSTRSTQCVKLPPMKPPYREERPWGKFEQFTHNEQTTVKIISVNPNEELSLQYHDKRDEFWRVLDGNPILVIGDELVRAEPGDEFFVPRGINHRIMSEETPVHILEIAFGEFDEQDIVRLNDKYHRA